MIAHLCVASRYASLSNRFSVLSETPSRERVMPRCSSLSRERRHISHHAREPSRRETYDVFVDWKLDEMARTA